MLIRRRDVLALPSLATVPTPPGTALCLNEDNSHWFFTRAGRPITAEAVASFIDQYAGTQVREFILSANAQRTSFASKVWDPIWKGYDPDGPDDQPLFRSTAPAGRINARKWVDTAWRLHQAGLDPYQLWIARARRHGLAPWISMRMNDLHNVDDPESFMHGSFWREHPEFRRVPWRFADNRDRALDFGRPEVRDYSFRLIEEYCERYDFDGLELDWMRFGFHFRPGMEAAGTEQLTAFMRRTRTLLDQWQRRRGHRIQLGARVPSRPQTAIDLGMDGARWARERLIQMLVVTPFWGTIDTDIPLEQWRRLAGDRVTLAAGLELLVRPYSAYRPLQFNSLETVRGAAASMLARGADRVYLFNYMDSQTEMCDPENYQPLLHECGQLSTLAGKARRHIVTYPDTQAPGQPAAEQLPRTLSAGQWAAFRLSVGPRLQSAQVQLEVEDGPLAEVRLNGDPCRPTDPTPTPKPGPARGFHTWQAPRGAEGTVVIDVQAGKSGRVHWVEVSGT